MSKPPPPNRTAMVADAERRFAACQSMNAFWDVVDTLRLDRTQLLREGNTGPNAEIGTAARAAYVRLGGEL